MESKSKTSRNQGAASSEQLSGFSNLDVGSAQLAGSTAPVETGWDVVAGGADIWEGSDQFHFVYKKFISDFDVGLRVQSFSPAHLYSKAGLMIRESLTADSPHLMFLVFSDNSPRNNNLGGYEMQFRSVAGGNCVAVYPAVKPPAPPEFPVAFPNVWLRIERQGERFSALASTDGKDWKLYAAQTLALPSTVFVRPALTSHSPQSTSKAGFRDYRESR